MESNTNFFLRFFRSKIFVVILALVVLVLTFNLFVQFTNSQKVENSVEVLKKEISQIEKENNNFSNLVDYFNGDLFVEKEARTKLGLTKKGESVMVVENSQEGELELLTSPQEKKIINQPKTNPQIWWDYFFTNK